MDNLTPAKRFIESATKWGNLYRFRYYIDGRRVAEWRFDAAFNAMAKTSGGYARDMQNRPGGYRTIWTF